MSKCAVITGASRGIGKAIALEFAKLEYDIVINYASNEQAAMFTLGEIKTLGVNAMAVRADVSSYEESEQFIKSVLEKFGRIDVLVNNAGVTKDGLFARMSEQDWDDVMSTNLKSAYNCARHTVPNMLKKKSGSIINISSIAGVMGNAGQVNYSASKAGMIGFTKALAREIGKRGITVNAIAPGLIETDMTQNMNQDALARILERVPAGRMGTPEEIAQAVIFLANAKYINGQTLVMDGGMY